jgi:hypothetical protein
METERADPVSLDNHNYHIIDETLDRYNELHPTSYKTDVSPDFYKKFSTQKEKSQNLALKRLAFAIGGFLTAY